MMIIKSEVVEIASHDDIVKARQVVRSSAVGLGFNIVDQTKIVTATSELARNVFEYGGGGTVIIETVNDGGRRGLRLIFQDSGPGIKDIEQAMKDGFSTSSGLGLGLGGARRLMNEFDIVSKPGKGTTVTVTKWK
jgi:serine/threonine-protein kinase RsbT